MEYYSMRTVHRRILIFTSKKNPIEKLDIAINLMQLLLPQVSNRQNCKWNNPQNSCLPKARYQNSNEKSARKEEGRKKKEIVKSLDEIRPSIEKAAGRNLEKIYFFPSAPPHPVCRATAARGKVEGHVNTSGRERSLNKSA